MANVKAVVEKVVDVISGLVEVESLNADKVAESVFTTYGTINFENGTAKVSEEVAKYLRENGYIK